MLVLRREGQQDLRETLPPHGNLHLPLIEEFSDAVLNGREPAVSGETGRAVAIVEERIYSVRGD